MECPYCHSEMERLSSGGYYCNCGGAEDEIDWIEDSYGYASSSLYNLEQDRFGCYTSQEDGEKLGTNQLTSLHSQEETLQLVSTS